MSEKIFTYYTIIAESAQTIETLIQKRDLIEIAVPVNTFTDFLDNDKQIYFFYLYL